MAQCSLSSADNSEAFGIEVQSRLHHIFNPSLRPVLILHRFIRSVRTFPYLLNIKFYAFRHFNSSLTLPSSPSAINMAVRGLARGDNSISICEHSIHTHRNSRTGATATSQTSPKSS